MRHFTAGIWVLVLGYTLSQFYRAFLTVLSSDLREELGATPGDLAVSSGMWFVGFAVMQVPVGRWLDQVGPRRTASGMMVAAALGAAIFAMAQAPWHLHLAMALIGVGCAPALMSAYYIFARNFSVREFGTLAGTFVAVGALGNLLSATPLVAVTEAIGWRATLWGMFAVTLLVAVVEWLVVKDPERLDAAHPQGRLSDILRLRALWFILPLFAVIYGVSAAIRGLWAGPYLEDVFAASNATVGNAALLMGITMVLGNYFAGPVMQMTGSVRRTILVGAAASVAVTGALWLFAAQSLALSVTLLALVGLSGASYVLLISHGRAFLPQHLVGRGMTFLNMVSIGGTGLLQFGSRPVFQWASAQGNPAAAYATVFLFFTIPLAIGLGFYFLTPEAPHD
jgi:predicted MFS family arabinose efflux permease